MMSSYLLVGLIVAAVMAVIVLYWVIQDNRGRPEQLTEITSTEGRPKQNVAILTERVAVGALNSAWDDGFKLAISIQRLNRQQRRNLKKGFVQKKRAEHVQLHVDRLVGKGVEE